MIILRRIILLITALTLLAACSFGGDVPANQGNPTQQPSIIAQVPTSAATQIPTAAPDQPTAQPDQPTAQPEQPTDAPQLTVVATGEPADDKALLPAPVYMLSSQPSGVQLMRVGNDLKTVTQISNEPAGVEAFAIASNGNIAYITGNTLVTIDRDGNNRTELFVGPAVDLNSVDDAQAKKLSNPVWSADASKLWFSFGGINEISAGGGTPTNIMPHEEASGTQSPYRFSKIFTPLQLSPDGTKLLIGMNFVLEGGTWGFMDVATKNVTPINISQMFPCCYATWSNDSQTLWYSNDAMGMVPAGLWRVDMAGNVQQVLGTSDGDPPWSLVGNVDALEDGSLLAFFKETSDLQEASDVTQRQLTLSRITADGKVTPLRTDAQSVGEVLWATTGEGALIVPSYIAEVNPEWVPADGSGRTTLPISGTRMQWGK